MVALYMFKLWRLGVLRAFLLARLSIVRLSAIPTYTRIYGTVPSVISVTFIDELLCGP